MDNLTKNLNFSHFKSASNTFNKFTYVYSNASDWSLHLFITLILKIAEGTLYTNIQLSNDFPYIFTPFFSPEPSPWQIFHSHWTKREKYPPSSISPKNFFSTTKLSTPLTQILTRNNFEALWRKFVRTISKHLKLDHIGQQSSIPPLLVLPTAKAKLEKKTQSIS